MFQNHQYKFLAAVHEEASSIHPALAGAMLAPVITYLPNASDPDSEELESSLHAMNKAGV